MLRSGSGLFGGINIEFLQSKRFLTTVPMTCFLRRFLLSVEMTGVCGWRGSGKSSGEAAAFSIPL